MNNTPAILPGVPTPIEHMPPEQVKTMFSMLSVKAQTYAMSAIPEMAIGAAMSAAGGTKGILGAALASPYITAAVITIIALLIIGLYVDHLITTRRTEEALDAQQAQQKINKANAEKARTKAKATPVEAVEAREKAALEEEGVCFPPMFNKTDVTQDPIAGTPPPHNRSKKYSSYNNRPTKYQNVTRVDQ